MTKHGTGHATRAGMQDRHRAAQVEVLVSAAAGVVVAVALGLVASLSLALLVGWDAMCVVYLVWIWCTILHQDADQTAHRATTTDPDRRVTDALVLAAAVASLAAVGSVLLKAAQLQGVAEGLRVGLGLASVVLSWAMVHTVFTLRYAHLYYAGPDGGVDFNDSEPPTYVDFAYLAFTIGMTFQVSDTSLTSRDIRHTALRHSLLSYLFGTGILATTVNLVASLSSK
jgi:uncharacterized membrane protein